MPTTLADLQSKIVVDGVSEAIKGLTAVASVFDSTAQSATRASRPVDDIVLALSKFGIIKTAVTGLIDLGRSTIQIYASTERWSATGR